MRANRALQGSPGIGNRCPHHVGHPPTLTGPSINGAAARHEWQEIAQRSFNRPRLPTSDRANFPLRVIGGRPTSQNGTYGPRRLAQIRQLASKVKLTRLSNVAAK